MPIEVGLALGGNQMDAAHGDGVFSLKLNGLDSRWGRLAALMRKPAERLLCFDKLNAVYHGSTPAQDATEFLAKSLECLGIAPVITDADLDRIPKTGPVVVVANHPYGGIDGILLGHLLKRVRPDVRIMANYMLGCIPELRDLFTFVDPFGGATAAASNRQGLKQTLDHLRAGGLLAVFPAGEVAHLDVHKRRIVESPWSDTVARIIRKTGAAAVPVYFDGRNSKLFHAAGLLHPMLRTMLLPREVFKKRGHRVEVRVGRTIPFPTLRSIAGDTEMMAYLRLRTTMLRSRAGERSPAAQAAVAKQPKGRPMEPIADATPVDLLCREIADLPAEALLVQQDALQVYIAHAPQVPRVLREIGRLRELTFRGVGEGTGKRLDIDEFDAYYLHLFVWNKTKREVVGSYRLGRTDEVVRRLGTRGLYTSTLFQYKQRLLDEMGPALEMGRSFIRPEYQRNFSPLLLLWKGIGNYVVAHPRYKTLFGPVSISNEYQGASRQIMVAFLRMHEYLPGMAKWVKPRSPFRKEALGAWADDDEQMRDIDHVSDVIADLENSERGVPILLKQYLKMGGKLLGFNVDPDFSDVVDGLILVDLTKTDPRVLSRYMGKGGLAQFLAYHGKAREGAPA